jgi:hypothetical protein
MTREEYEERARRLKTEIEDARKALMQTRGRYDRLCDEARDLRYAWRDQQRATEK